MKTYLAPHIFAPKLAAAVGLPEHVKQTEVVVVAARKADIGPLCEDRGLPPGHAAAVRRAAVANNTFTHLLAARAAGLIPADQAGVYAIGGQSGQRIVRVELDGTLTVIGHWTRDGYTVVAVPGPPHTA